MAQLAMEGVALEIVWTKNLDRIWVTTSDRAQLNWIWQPDSEQEPD